MSYFVILYYICQEMVLQSFILFIAALLGGAVVFFIPPFKQNIFKHTLVFVGGYLFSITMLHILPGLFASYPSPPLIGLYVLIGFFLQLLLEFFSRGVEHGHMYENSKKAHEKLISPFTLLIALCIHGFLDGVILTDPTSSHPHHTHKGNILLLGIVLHKISEAFALVTVLLSVVKNTNKAIVYLFLFALFSPIGLWVSEYFNQQLILSQESFMILFAIVSGNFLHISTTIFFESNPEHHNTKKVVLSLLGASLAVLLEFLL